MIYYGYDCPTCGGTTGFNQPCPWCEVTYLRADLDRKNTLLALQTDRLNELNKSVVQLGADFDEAVDRAAYFHDLLSTATQEITRLREALKDIADLSKQHDTTLCELREIAVDTLEWK